MLVGGRAARIGGTLRGAFGLLQHGLPSDMADVPNTAGSACLTRHSAHHWYSRPSQCPELWASLHLAPRDGDSLEHVESPACSSQRIKSRSDDGAACRSPDPSPSSSPAANPPQSHSSHYLDVDTSTACDVMPERSWDLAYTGDGSRGTLLSAAAMLVVAASPAEAADGFGPVVGAMHLIDGLHSVTGLPWWATFATVAAGVRLAMLPLTLQQMRASAMCIPLIQQARALGKQAAAPSAAEGTAGDVQQMRQTILQHFWRLRRERNAPHPAWMIVAPLVQLPVFVTTMWAARRMALLKWAGIEQGGLGWFPDLTVPALDLSAPTVQYLIPLGSVGIVMPVLVVAGMFGNLALAFGDSGAASGRSAVAAWLGGKLRLFLEWLTLPMFLVALQLPHAPLCYWLSSTLAATAQHMLLRAPAVRVAMGSVPPLAPPPGSLATHPPVDPELVASAANTTDIPALFHQAANLVVAKQFASAAAVLQRILELFPRHPQACYALGQVHRATGNWAEAAEHYGVAGATLEKDMPIFAARAWLSRGEALDRMGDNEGALSALSTAAGLAKCENAPEQRIKTYSRPPKHKVVRARDPPQQDFSATFAAVCGTSKTEFSWKIVALDALLAQGSILARAGCIQEAVDVVRQAVALEPRLRDKYLTPLEKELAK